MSSTPRRTTTSRQKLGQRHLPRAPHVKFTRSYVLSRHPCHRHRKSRSRQTRRSATTPQQLIKQRRQILNSLSFCLFFTPIICCLSDTNTYTTCTYDLLTRKGATVESLSLGQTRQPSGVFPELSLSFAISYRREYSTELNWFRTKMPIAQLRIS